MKAAFFEGQTAIVQYPVNLNFNIANHVFILHMQDMKIHVLEQYYGNWQQTYAVAQSLKWKRLESAPGCAESEPHDREPAESLHCHSSKRSRVGALPPFGIVSRTCSNQPSSTQSPIRLQ